MSPDLSSAGMGDIPPPLTHQKNMRGVEWEARLSRLNRRTMTPIYTRSACTSICIFKNTLPCFLVCSVCVFACALVHWQGCAHVVAMCLRGRQQLSCVRHMCNTLLSVTRDQDFVAGIWPCVATQLNLFLIIVQDWDSGKERLGPKWHAQGILPLKLAALLFTPSKYLITTHLYSYPQLRSRTFFFQGEGGQTFNFLCFPASQRWIEIGPSWCY